MTNKYMLDRLDCWGPANETEVNCPVIFEFSKVKQLRQIGVNIIDNEANENQNIKLNMCWLFERKTEGLLLDGLKGGCNCSLAII